VKRKNSQKQPSVPHVAGNAGELAADHGYTVPAATGNFDAQPDWMAWMRANHQWFAWPLILAPVLLCFYYVNTYGVNVVWEDSWGLYPILEKADAGTLTLADFWKQHNEHRHAIPKIIMYYLARATNWNAVAEMWVSQSFLLCMLAMMLSAFWRECRSSCRAWLMVPVAWLMMTLRQNQNLLFGWQIGFVLIAASATAALYCLYLMNTPRLHALKFAGAVAAGTVAVCSGGSGPLVWIAGFVPLTFLPLARGNKIILAVTWAVIGAAEWAFYFYGYQKPPSHPHMQFSTEYLLAIVGASLFPILLLATIVGLIILLLAAASVAASISSGKIGRFSFWLGIMFYGLLADGVTTLGRSGGIWGVGQALSARYATFSVLIVIGIYGTLSCLAAENRARPISASWGCLFSLIVLGLVLSTVEGFETAQLEQWQKQQQAFVISTADTQPDVVLEGSGKSPEPRHGGVALLKRHGWSVFAPGGAASRYAVPPPDLPVLPKPAQLGWNQSGPSKEANYLTISGYAVNTEGNDVVGDVYLDIDGTIYPTYYGIPQPDLAQRLKLSGPNGSPRPDVDVARVTRCVFRRSFIPGLLSKGTHRLTFKVRTKDGTAYFASPGWYELRVD
jgi:hypothetical protein